ncbi:MAG: hypothetical protein D6714_03365 [Bacteroidetes bacterium]|nr:MAG: hypothetical protein D6714_03365 [Bacteroidota bacterium]
MPVNLGQTTLFRSKFEGFIAPGALFVEESKKLWKLFTQKMFPKFLFDIPLRPENEKPVFLSGFCRIKNSVHE